MKSIGIIGSGNWGSAIAKLLGEKVKEMKEYNDEVKMWVFQEQVDGKNLTDIINQKHENVKYLPEIKLPENVVAYPEIKDVVSSSNVLIFVIPHEFLDRTLSNMEQHIQKNTIGITLIKGAFFREQDYVIISEDISKRLNISMCSLMGANIANDVARENFSESTVEGMDEEVGQEFASLFSSRYFKVRFIQSHGVAETCGVLKNVVAMGCGIASGRGAQINTIAAIIRNGFLEVIRFCDLFVSKTSTETHISSVFLESCGIADMIVTCVGGRNFRFSKIAAEKDISIEEVEKSEMNGQKLQGYSTGKDLKVFLEKTGKQKEFPLLYAICCSSQEKKDLQEIIQAIP
ncbi:glycerol-3-phosphate dehydrogenase (NAD+) [Nematocida sp. LUAm3]|nr:glycerol-3-phosphate dehydrogenase (NAD+) [Nematocida sp. LUAm3]KAI5174635.1 glycerol-3-phosphate dehydrogenase (NAD+) [Nematocida sp. LUAm2]KAI5177959.1 glycerol-3-phosphate dehydrogenase (NAD+) [Nematocida sp. LUAm1]